MYKRQELADLADLYVCDAFGSSHRAHASVAGVTKFISAKGGSNVVGYLMEKEIAFLGNAVENPVRPFVAILGGAKVADKLNVISNLLEKCDTLIIGGGMAYTFLKAQGKEIGDVYKRQCVCRRIRRVRVKVTEGVSAMGKKMHPGSGAVIGAQLVILLILTASLCVQLSLIHI